MTAHKAAFSLVELLLGIIVISFITAAFVPVISKKLASSEVTINNPSEQDEAHQAKIMLEAMKSCKLNEEKTKLICEVELSELKNSEPYSKEIVLSDSDISKNSVNIKYSERRDKIRFDNKETGNYKTTSYTNEHRKTPQYTEDNIIIERK